ncbi:MAG: GIDE domain-containing protein [Terriglobia bacterium]
MSKNSDPTFWLVIGLGAGLVTFFRGFKVYREYRVVDDTPLIPIRSMPMGLVNIQGKASGEERLTSPVTRTPCYFYKVVIEKWKQESNKSGWEHYRTDAGAVKFYLEDASGKVLVDSQNAEFDLQMACEREVRGDGSRSTSLQMGAAPDTELLSYISQAGANRVTSFIERRLETAGPLHNAQQEQMRQQLMGALKNPLGSPGFAAGMGAFMAPILQQKLAAHEPLADPQQEQARQAMAEAFKHPIGSPEFAEQARRAQALLPPGSAEGQQLTAWIEKMEQGTSHPEGFFPPATGRFRLKEYCIVVGQQYDVVGTCAENPSPQDEHDHNLMMKGINEPTYLISDRPRGKVESHLRNRSLLMVFGGAGLTILCLALLLARFGLF